MLLLQRRLGSGYYIDINMLHIARSVYDKDYSILKLQIIMHVMSFDQGYQKCKQDQKKE